MQDDPQKLGSILRWKFCPFCSRSLETILQREDKRAHYTCTNCKRSHYPHLYVGANMILECQDHVLMIHRREEPRIGTLDIPGGFTEQVGDDPEKTARRELKEEVGIILPREVSLEYICALPDIYREDEPVISMVYLAHLPGDMPLVVASSDAVDAHWVRWDEIDIDRIGFESIRQAIKIYQERRS